MSARSSIWWKGPLTALAALTMLLGLIAALYAALQTEAARAGLANALARALSTPGKIEVTITRLEGPLPERVRLEGVTVRDPDGEWLSLDSLTMDWRPLALLRGELHIASLEASRVRLERLPAVGDEDAAAERAALPRLPLDVKVDGFTVDELALAGPVLGEPARFRIEGAAGAREATQIRTALGVVRIDGTPGEIELEAVYDLALSEFDLAMKASEPQGGLIARALELRGLPAVAIDLNGSGPIENWRGRLGLRVEHAVSLDADLAIGGIDPFVLRARGDAELAALPGGPVGRLFGPALAFEIESVWVGDGVLDVRRAHVESSAAALALTGRLDAARMVATAKAEMTVRNPAPVNELIAPVRLQAATATAELSGPLMKPDLRLELALGGASADGLATRAAHARLTLSPDRPLRQAGVRIAIAAEGRFEELTIDSPELQALLGPTPTWSLEGRYELDGETLEARRFAIAGRGAEAEASGFVNFRERATDAALKVSLRDLAPLGPLVDLPLSGEADVEAHVRSPDLEREVEALVVGEARNLALGERAVEVLLGRRTAFSFDARAAAGEPLRLTALTVDGEAASLAGDAVLSAGGRMVDARLTLDIPSLESLSSVVGAPLSGRLRFDGTAKGALADPAVAGTLAFADLRVKTTPVGTLEGPFTIASPITRPQGRLSLAGETPLGPAEAATAFAMTEGRRLRLTGLELRAKETQVTGDLTIPLDEGTVEGTLTGRAGSLAPWSEIAGTALSGALEFDLRLSGENSRQAGELSLSGRDIAAQFPGRDRIHAGELELTARGTDLVRKPTGLATASLRDVRYGKMYLDVLSLHGDGDLASAKVAVKAAGDLDGPLGVDTAGTIRREDERLVLVLERLAGHGYGRSVVLAKPATLSYAPHQYAVEDLVLDLDGGQIAASGRLTRDELSAAVDVAGLPLSLVTLAAPKYAVRGRLDGTARLEGPVSSPSGEFRLQAAELRLAAEAASDLPALGGRVTGTWRGGRLSAEGTIEGFAETAAKLKADVPLRLSAEPLALAIPADEPIEGELTWRGDAAHMAEILALDAHRLAGPMDVVVNVDGTVASPAVTGRATLSRGSYESLVAGAALRDVEIVIEAQGERLVLTRAAAKSGASGRVLARGALELDPARGYPIDLGFDLEDATVLQRDDITAVASGKLALSGSLENATLAGRIETSLVEARLVDTLPPEVIDLDVIEIDAGEEKPAPEPAAAATRRASALGLDLVIAMPRRAFLRGRGLDSEWGGELAVKGTADRPVVAGVLRPIRGAFAFAGKTFTLQEGSVTFTGAAEIDPALDLSAEYARRDIRAVIRVGGSARKPDIKLTSVPELPRDEVLARILFNKNAGQLSPVEAVQLAESLAALTGRVRSSLGFLDVARRTLGVDVLRIGASEAGDGAAVRAGKYVSEGVFVGVEQGTEPGSTTATVEVEVTPSITVESDVGAAAGSRVGVKWKRDY